MISTIISSGQCAAGRGAIDAARYAGIPLRGWYPKAAVVDRVEELRAYGLEEMESADAEVCGERNIALSDATLILTSGHLVGTARSTAMMCDHHRKPWLHIDLDERSLRRSHLHRPPHDLAIAKKIQAWIERRCDERDGAPEPPPVCKLYVTGRRELCPSGMRLAVKRCVVDVLIATRSAWCLPIWQLE